EDVVGPEALAAELEGAVRREGHVVVDHRHEWASLTDEAGPVPDAPEVGHQPHPHVAAQRAVARREVPVPGLLPQPLGARGVGSLVGGRQVEIAHRQSMAPDGTATGQITGWW